MPDRFAQDIRRIVGYDETKKSLDTSEDKGAINGTRGIAFQSADGFAGTTGDSSTQYGASDIIDNVGEFPTNGAGTLDAIDDIVDCATGKDMKLRLDGILEPPTGWNSDGSPPEGYYDGTITVTSVSGDGLDVFEWTQGERWGSDPSGSPTISYFSTAGQAMDDMKARTSAIGLGSTLTAIAYETTGSGQYRMTWSTPNFVEFVTRVPGCTLDIDEGCPGTEPAGLAPEWPADNEMQLIWDGEKFTVPESEPDADRVSKYTDNKHSTVDFCFGPGGARQGTITPTATGGFAVYETSGGSPIGSATIYGSDRKVIVQVDAATGLDMYLPAS